MRIFKKEEPTATDDEIKRVLDEMNRHEATDPEYKHLMKLLERLHKLKAAERPKQRVSRDTMLIVAGNLAGILLIAAYEQERVLTPKALGQLIRPVIRSATN